MKFRLDRGVVRWWLIALGLLLARPSFAFALAGAGLLALGMALHLWSKGCLNQNRQLTVCGPYRWSRNPFYVANFLIDLGLAVLINIWPLTVAYLIVWIIVYRRQIVSEERTLEGIYGDAWHAYRRQVPVFFPYKRPYRDVPADQGFSWSNPNLAHGSEIPRLIRIASYPLLLLIAARVRPRWALSGPQDLDWLVTLPGLLCLGGVIALQGLATLLKRQLRRTRPVLRTFLDVPHAS